MLRDPMQALERDLQAERASALARINDLFLKAMEAWEALEAGLLSSLETRIVADERDYKIGPEDVLDISVWKAPELSRTVPVRPDGKVSLPLINDIQAAGLTPSVLRQQLAVEDSQHDSPTSPLALAGLALFPLGLLVTMRRR